MTLSRLNPTFSLSPIIMLIERVGRSREGVLGQWVKCLSCKQEDLSSDPWHPGKSRVQWYVKWYL